MCLARGPQRSDAGEARTRGPSFSSQALYHWATVLPLSSHRVQYCRYKGSRHYSRGARYYGYTGIQRFMSPKIRIAICFWLYRFTQQTPSVFRTWFSCFRFELYFYSDVIFYFNLALLLIEQEMSQSRDECPQRNWSSIRHIRGKLAVI